MARKPLLLALVVASLVVACGADSSVTPDNLNDSIVCTGPTDQRPNCAPDPDYEWDISGTFTVANGDCAYVDASSNNADQMGLPCDGSVSLCQPKKDATGWTTLTYSDIGPNGAGNGFAVYASSYKSSTGDDFQVFGTDTVESQGCTSTIDIALICTKYTSSYHCRKWSGVRSSSCADTSGWVESFGQYTYTPGCH